MRTDNATHAVFTTKGDAPYYVNIVSITSFRSSIMFFYIFLRLIFVKFKLHLDYTCLLLTVSKLVY